MSVPSIDFLGEGKRYGCESIRFGRAVQYPLPEMIPIDTQDLKSVASKNGLGTPTPENKGKTDRTVELGLPNIDPRIDIPEGPGFPIGAVVTEMFVRRFGMRSFALFLLRIPGKRNTAE